MPCVTIPGAQLLRDQVVGWMHDLICSRNTCLTTVGPPMMMREVIGDDRNDRKFPSQLLIAQEDEAHLVIRVPGGSDGARPA